MKYPAIELKNVSFAAGHRNILKNLCLAVNQGEIISIIGPNGAGKTTLLKCLIRIHETKQDAIMVMGKPISAYTQKKSGTQNQLCTPGQQRPPAFFSTGICNDGALPVPDPFEPPHAKGQGQRHKSPCFDRYLQT